MLQLCALHNNSSSYSKNYRNCTRPSWLCPAPTRSALTNQAETSSETKIHRYQTVQAQTSLILSIPNYILPRQAKSVELCILFQHSQIKSAISPQIIKTVVEVARCALVFACGACPRLRIEEWVAGFAPGEIRRLMAKSITCCQCLSQRYRPAGSNNNYYG